MLDMEASAPIVEDVKNKNMNEKLQNQLSSLLEWAERATTTGVNFVVEQTPLYVTELLNYNFWVSVIIFGCFSFLFITCLVCLASHVIYKNKKKNWTDEDALLIAPLSFVIFLFIWGMAANAEWLKIWLAPRVYIIDYLRSELNK